MIGRCSPGPSPRIRFSLFLLACCCSEVRGARCVVILRPRGHGLNPSAGAICYGLHLFPIEGESGCFARSCQSYQKTQLRFGRISPPYRRKARNSTAAATSPFHPTALPNCDNLYVFPEMAPQLGFPKVRRGCTTYSEGNTWRQHEALTSHSTEQSSVLLALAVFLPDQQNRFFTRLFARLSTPSQVDIEVSGINRYPSSLLRKRHHPTPGPGIEPGPACADSDALTH